MAINVVLVSSELISIVVYSVVPSFITQCHRELADVILRQFQMIDKVGQLLWAWFSRPRKLADKIVEPQHTADFILFATLYTISASFTDTQQLNADHKMMLALCFQHLMNENNK